MKARVPPEARALNRPAWAAPLMARLLMVCGRCRGIGRCGPRWGPSWGGGAYSIFANAGVLPGGLGIEVVVGDGAADGVDGAAAVFADQGSNHGSAVDGGVDQSQVSDFAAEESEQSGAIVATIHAQVGVM